ncbi:MAG: hypothetical protein KAJ51_00580 [Thermoplasmata archaeon]|nr:hypothetical protein [Thermoplasmata archaeon]
MCAETSLKIIAKMPCYPTEDSRISEKGLKNIFPDMKIQQDPESQIMTGEGKSLAEFGELLKRYRIRDTARKILLRGTQGNTTNFKLNKQTAVIGKINFVGSREPQVLGEIDVAITSNDLEELIDEIAPGTVNTSTPRTLKTEEESDNHEDRDL